MASLTLRPSGADRSVMSFHFPGCCFLDDSVNTTVWQGMEGERTNNITIFKLSSDLILLLGQSCLAGNILAMLG